MGVNFPDVKFIVTAGRAGRNRELAHDIVISYEPTIGDHEEAEI